MGYDPYWPTSVAAVNVACLPAAAIDPVDFEKIKKALTGFREFRNADLGPVGKVDHGMWSK